MKQTGKTEGIFLSKDASAAASYADGWAAISSQLQGILTSFGETGLAPITTSMELAHLVNRTDQFIFERQTGGALNVSGASGQAVAVNVDQMAALVQKPANYQQIVTKIEALKNLALNLFWNIQATGKHFRVESGKVCYSDEVQMLIDTAGELWAKTEKGQAIARFLNRVKDAFFEEGMERYFYKDTYLGKPIIRPERLSPTLSEWGLSWFSVENKTMVFQRADTPHPEFRGDR